MHIQFLGANRQVTGSCYFVHAGGLRLMIDCGMFQERPFLDRNWTPTAVDPQQIDFLLLTHAHLDHAGLLPKLVREGFRNPILTTAPSMELTRIVLLDAARIQEEDAEYKRRRHEREGRKGRHPVAPLYTVADAEKVPPLMRATPYRQPVALNDRVSVTFHDAGHILGSAMLELTVKENGRSRRLIFSGDIGQRHSPIIHDPSVFDRADYVVMESTYGDRDHDHAQDVCDSLARVINDTVHRGGNVVIPTFAIERAQELMYHFSSLVREKRIPRLMIFVDSPMAVDVTDVFRRHQSFMDEQARALFASGQPPFHFPGLKLVRSADESKAINRIKGSCVIMAGSGMCTGGRVKHHLVANISRPQSTVLFVGYQAQHTLGRQILDGHPQVRIHGQTFSVRARIEQIPGLSAHADRTALLQWLDHLKSPPRQLFLTHGEEDTALNLAAEIERTHGYKPMVPEYQETWNAEAGA